MRNWIRTIGWILLTVAATYVICEWAVWQKSGLHDLREEDMLQVMSVPMEPERAALYEQVERLAETFADFRAAKEREIQGLERLIANLERQIRTLTAQRTPVEQVAALRAASRPVRWRTMDDVAMAEGRSVKEHARASYGVSAAPSPSVPLLQLAREAGFTKVEVRR